jgi:soluble lytic murein transglycosylase-like protein
MSRARAKTLRKARRDTVPVAASLTVVAGLLGACAGDGNAFQFPGQRSHSPSEIRALVVEEAVRMNISASLALAVAHAESNFNPRAESHAGARGVMQIMPATAKGEYNISPGLLWNPRVNVRLGLHFLKRLIRRYRGRVDLALSHYNGGSAVGRFPNARVIPATRRYVQRVQYLRTRYRAWLLRRDV